MSAIPLTKSDIKIIFRIGICLLNVIEIATGGGKIRSHSSSRRDLSTQSVPNLWITE